MKVMTLGTKRYKMFLLLVVVMMLLTGCSLEKKVTIYFDGGDTITVSESEAKEMMEQGLIDENYVYQNQIISNEGFATETEQEKLRCDTDTSRYYYNQLNDTEKEIYDNLVDSTELFIENSEVFCVKYPGDKGIQYEYGEYTERAVRAYMSDNPLSSLWINSMEVIVKSNVAYVNGEYSHIDSFEVYIVPLKEKGTFGDFETPDETREAVRLVEKEVREFVKTLSGTDAEKYKQIHDWIIERGQYDDTMSVPNLRSVYGAIIQQNCVCAGFAHAYKYVSDVAGLNVLYISGLGKGESHAWNHVWVDGEWLLVDVTWDLDPITVIVETDEIVEEYINSEGYIVRRYGSIETYEPNYTYFLVNIQEEADNGNHIEEAELKFEYVR